MGEAARTFLLAERYNFRVTWIGHRGAVHQILRNLPAALVGNKKARLVIDTCIRRIRGALFWRTWDHRYE